ncbi:Retrovirus-related Pol polyprotein from transposon RE1 [Vitis vinifera]|uniref:Retrovirus-related Pol polyprotein from transposon RE1 n=1 Tax=Vitis vinifera TaxID=29760 RepID=A0A438JJX4_VITVI|nr:Retrovirus-related Pol polyprotein from transposon RE1 [Vitis vinifera]
MHIAEREKLPYIRGKINPPKESEDGYEKWYAENQKDKVVMKDPNDIAAYWKSIERQRVHIFLVGLDGDFEEVRAEILRKDHFPDLEECYALIRREVVRHASMKTESDNLDTSVMDSKKTSTAAVAEIKTEANVTKNASALVATTDYDVVPSLDYNLLSVSQITAALFCIVIFWPEFCVFKDIQTRQTISCGIKRGKLHYLDLQSKDSNKLRQTLIADGSESEEKKSKIWLWHQHLGHLPPGCMVSKKQCQKQHGKITTLIVYVDDMVVIGNDPEERKALQNYLSREFEMKDLDPLKYFLGIEVSRSSERIFLSQRKYALDLLQEIGMSGCQPVDTPIEEGPKLCVEPNQVSTDKGRYQRLVGD